MSEMGHFLWMLLLGEFNADLLLALNGLDRPEYR